MVKPFQFARIPKICFKAGQISDLPDIIKVYGTRIIFLTGENSFMRSAEAGMLLNSFDTNHLYYKHVKVGSEPSPDMVDQLVTMLNEEQADVVLAIGGGSVIDAGKAISAMMFRNESVKEYLEGVGTRVHPGSKLPFIAVPTTSGTGSEATKNAVLTQTGIDGFKKSLRHDNFVPEIAIVDPALTLHCPQNITAASGMDCFTQLTEAFLSDKSNEYTDALAFEGLKAVKSSLRQSVSDGEDITARSGMSFAALTSGICLANAGLGVVHGFASSIGGKYNIPHGVVCGTLMGSANMINIRELRKKGNDSAALRKYAVLGKLFLDRESMTQDYYIDGFIQYLYSLTNDLLLPALKEYGVEEKDIELICSITENKNNPVTLKLDDMVEIVTSRL
jgi:alcohol dehydrogenase class IV